MSADLPPGMVPAEKLATRARREPSPDAASGAPVDPATEDRRDRLVERFVLLQCELGGLYYEMAIRGSVRDDVLQRRAAELQRVDLELARVERILRGEDALAESCPSCGAPAGRADQFCSSCGRPLALPPASNGNGGGPH